MDVMVYSPRPPPVEQDIPLLLRHPLPPPPRFCALLPAASPPRTMEEGEPAPPCGTGWFPLCECMAILSPNPPPVEKDGFPFWRHIHTLAVDLLV